LLSNTRALQAINQNLFSRPEEARQEAERMVGVIADSMLVEADLAVHLMADKLGGEDAYHHSLNVTDDAPGLRERRSVARIARVSHIGPAPVRLDRESRQRTIAPWIGFTSCP